VETLHGRLGSSLLQGIDDPLFKRAPVVEGFYPEEVDQGEEFLDLVLTAVKVSNAGTPNSMETDIGVPVRHQRWLPSSSKQAFALLVNLFLIVCASSNEGC